MMVGAVVGAAVSVLLKALGPVADPVLEAWAASKGLGANVKALKTELLCVKAVLEPRLGTEIRNSALEELLWNLQDLAYDAEDVLDELEYFRIQDELCGTFDAADEHPKGCAHNLVLNATHTAKAVGRKIWLPACTSAASAPGARLRASSTISSSPRADGDGGEVNGCKPKLAAAPSRITRAVGKCLPCSSLPPPVHDDDGEDDDINPPGEHGKEITKSSEFNRVDVSKRIELILQQLQPMCQKVCMILGPLDLDSNQQSSAAKTRPDTTSESTEPKLYGRDPIMKSIIHDITCGKYNGEDLTVLPIFGPGGIGKTALAQHIYHSQEVLELFDVRIWMCVSLNFNVDKLTEGIEKYVPRIDNENIGTAAELIGQRLKSKRFLLVLDDMWECSNDDEWARLLLPFRKSQRKGNIIIVTTRQPALAEVITKPNHSIELGGLAFEVFKDLFVSFVFNDEQSRKDHPELLEIGDKIMEKLKGSPLAAKTVGRLLRHHLDSYHWTRVLESQEWTEQNGDNDIMPALKLSYDHLPFYLKPCFCYCALFPQDYKFGREELVHLWIGLDVLHSHGENKRIEDIGLSHLAELVNHGFLKNEEEYGQTYYVIHDLLHELALKVSSRECLSIYSSNVGSIQVLPSVRHLSINIDDTSCQDRMTFNSCMMHLSTLDKDKGLKVGNLQSLMLFGRYHGSFVKTLCDLFRQAKGLRVLFLSEASYNVEDLLPNILKFIHLRYLRIVESDVFGLFRRLPNNIWILYQLRVLDIQRCNIDNVLPRDITNLIKLRHLLVPNIELHSSILEVGRLKWLQQLRRFVVKKENQGFELRQIGDLVQLCGSLHIDSLENINGKEEAYAAKLLQKTRLHRLQLHWDIDRFTKNSTQEEQVLECLKPSSNLRELSINGHGGYTCPSWLGLELSVQNLESLSLKNLAWKIFPPIGGDLWLTNEHGEELVCNTFDKKFQNLRRLELINLPTLKKWVGDTPCQLFAHLEVLIIRGCSKLIELSFPHSNCCQKQKEAKINWFPKLRELKIKDCPKLLAFASIPWTRDPCSVQIQGVGSGIEELIYKQNYKSEYRLKIRMEDALVSELWNVLAFDNLPELKELNMHTCPALPLHHFQKLSSLQTLGLYRGSSIIFPLVKDESNAEYQSLVECITVSEWSASAKELTQLLTYFTKLSKLNVRLCKKITGLAVVEKQATETPTPACPDNQVNEEIGHHQQQQDGTRREKEIDASSSEGLLLLPSQLETLWIRGCPDLCLISNSIDHNKEAGRTSGGQGFQALRSLRSLVIADCPRFLSSYWSSSSSSWFRFPTSLECLSLYGAVGMPLSVSNLTSLTDLIIGRCGDLRVKGLWSLLAHGCLTKLEVRKTPNFWAGSEPPLPHEQEFPSSSSKLQDLKTDDVAGVLDASICTFLSSSLTELIFDGDKEVERFTKEQEDALQLLTSLEEFRFWQCDKLQCLPAGLHRLPNLKTLSIDNCPAIGSLPKDCLPSSLQKIKIESCLAIRSLPKVNELPSSLRELNVRYSESEELRRQCRKLMGIIPVVYT